MGQQQVTTICGMTVRFSFGRIAVIYGEQLEDAQSIVDAAGMRILTTTSSFRVCGDERVGRIQVFRCQLSQIKSPIQNPVIYKPDTVVLGGSEGSLAREEQAAARSILPYVFVFMPFNKVRCEIYSLPDGAWLELGELARSKGSIEKLLSNDNILSLEQTAVSSPSRRWIVAF